MRAKIVNENINFERGGDSKRSLSVGLSEKQVHKREMEDLIEELKAQKLLEEILNENLDLYDIHVSDRFRGYFKASVKTILFKVRKFNLTGNESSEDLLYSPGFLDDEDPARKRIEHKYKTHA